MLGAAEALAIGAPAPGPELHLGLRPTALVLDPGGRPAGRALLVSAAPDGMLLTVLIDGVGQVQAIGPAQAGVQPGDEVRLRLEPSATAIIRR